MGESPRWHDGRFWMCDWLAGEVLAFAADGDARGGGPGRRAAVLDRLAARRTPRGSPPPPAWSPGRTWRRTAPPGSRSTRSWSTPPATAGWTCPARCRGRSGSPASSRWSGRTGRATQVADDVWFPNGMAIIDDDHPGRRRVARRPADRVDDRRRRHARRPPGLGRSSARARRRTASASTRPGRDLVRLGARSSTACASPRAARCSRPSRPTAAASPACSAATTAGPSTSWPTTTARRAPRTGSCSPTASTYRGPGRP